MTKSSAISQLTINGALKMQSVAPRQIALVRTTTPFSFMLNQHRCFSLRNLQNPFTSNVSLEERDASGGGGYFSAKDLLADYEARHTNMTFDDASKVLNKISHAVVPFDRTSKPYQKLLSQIKMHLRLKKPGTNLYNVIEATMKLHLEDGLPQLLRDRVINKQFSRSAYDIAIGLHYFGNLYRIHKSPEDKKAF